MKIPKEEDEFIIYGVGWRIEEMVFSEDVLCRVYYNIYTDDKDIINKTVILECNLGTKAEIIEQIKNSIQLIAERELQEIELRRQLLHQKRTLFIKRRKIKGGM